MKIDHSQEQLVLFTRYPEPGKTKTRLIPALGADGAADLQRLMTEDILKRIENLQQNRPVFLEISYEGGDPDLMRQWLSSEHEYIAQGAGDLGQRMSRSFASAFAAGKKRVLIVGTDCPGLNAELMARALDLLATKDIVLGPAADGGYYLIGLRQMAPELFLDIEWGSNSVLASTLSLAEQQGLSVALLAELPDIDRPEDLSILKDKLTQPGLSTRKKISIIIPTLNEEENLKTCLQNLLTIPDLEIIIADGGSKDNTVSMAQTPSLKIVNSPPGRARQMNSGAAAASNKILLFLHCDTLLPAGFTQSVCLALADPLVAAGAFSLKIAAPGLAFRLVEQMVNLRSRILGMPYGDQAIFITAKRFTSLGGFADLPIMEDYELIRRLKRHGRIRILSRTVTTSARRWQRHGLIKTTLINQLIIAGYWAGISPQRLARWYRHDDE